MRYQITKEQRQLLVEGNDICINPASKRKIIIGIKSNNELKLEELERKFEIKKAKLLGK